MKNLIFILIYFSLVFNAFGQTDPLSEFKSHKFPCDTGSSTVDINYCSGIKFDYADSLLNVVYNEIIKSLENEVIAYKANLTDELSNNNSSKERKDFIEFLNTQISYCNRLKQSIIKSHKTWIELRDLNLNVVSITCEGGTACTSIENQSLIEDTLARIEKLMSLYDPKY